MCVTQLLVERTISVQIFQARKSSPHSSKESSILSSTQIIFFLETTSRYFLFSHEERLRSNLPLVESEQDGLELETNYGFICPNHFVSFFQRGVHQTSLVQFASRTVAMAAVAFLEGAVHKRSVTIT